MLELLASYHDQWIAMAIKITGNREYAEDYVQEMYLKLHDKPVPPNLAGYVYMTINSIFVDEFRRAKKIKTVDSYTYQSDELGVMTVCESYTLLDRAASDFEVNYEELLPEQIEFEAVKAVFETLPDYKKDILRYSYEDGLREFCRLSGIGTNTVTIIRRKFKADVWKTLTTKSPEQMEILLSTTLQKMKCPDRVRSAKKDGLF